MIGLSVHLLLTLLWIAVSGSTDPGNVILGLVVTYGVLWWLHRLLGHRGGLYFQKMPLALSLAGVFVWELIKSNLRVAIEVLKARPGQQSGIVAIPLDVHDQAQITLLANLLTLTPGTLSLEVSEDRKVLYVHAMFLDDPEAVRREIKDKFEKRVMKLLSSQQPSAKERSL